MPVRVRTARLRSRLERLKIELPRAVESATYSVASHTTTQIVQQAESDGWRDDDDQVGFDFDQWRHNAYGVYTMANGYYGILSPEVMGTAEDFEKIAQNWWERRKGNDTEPTLWHTGMRMGDSFRRLVLNRPANKAALAEARQAIWGTKTPQWWFKNYGNYFAGAYPMKDGTYSIEVGANKMRSAIPGIVSNVVNAHLRREGLV